MRSTGAMRVDQRTGASLLHVEFARFDYLNYTANSLNQYSQRDVPGAADIPGAAHAQASLTVNGDSGVHRRGGYFWKGLSIDSTNAAVWQSVSVVGSLGGTNQTNAGYLFLPKTPETFAKANVAIVDGTNTFTAVAADALGRYDSNTVTAYLPATLTPAYDLNGNLRTNGTRLLDYDDENQLIRVTEPGAWKSEFVYDGKMRRRIRAEAIWQNGAWTTNLLVRYVYDGNLVLQERHYNPQLSTNNAQLLVTYTRGKDLSGSLEGAGGIGGLLARTDGALLAIGDAGAHAYYHADGNGNITALINEKQAVVARYLYDPYGNLLSAIGPLADANLYRFSSKELQPASGLYYYGYRFYEPTLQRWLNRDPIGETGFELARSAIPGCRRPERNLYVFVLNAPMNEVDPLGLHCSTHTVTGSLSGTDWLSLLLHRICPSRPGARLTYPNPCSGSTPYVSSSSVNPTAIQPPADHPWDSNLFYDDTQGAFILDIPTTTASAVADSALSSISISVECCSTPP